MILISEKYKITYCRIVFFLQKNSVRDFLIEFLSAGNLNQATNATKQNTNTNYYDERQYY